MITLPPAAEQYALDALLDTYDTWFHLYSNNPDPATVQGRDDLVELDTPAYAPQRVTTWAPAVIRDGRAVSDADPARWIRGTASQLRYVYGYFVTDGQGGPLVWWATPLSTPLDWINPADTVVVWPRLALRPIPAP